MKTELNILQTAFRLFLGKGFSDISTNEIIREAGTTKGGFYYCFKSREDLVVKVIETYLRPYYLQPLEEMRQAWENKHPDVSTKTLLWMPLAAALPQIPGKHWYGYCLSGFLLPAL